MHDFFEALISERKNTAIPEAFNPDTHAWDVAYGYTGKIIRLEAKKQEDMIILTYIDDVRRKWIFTEIEENRFHLQNVTVKNNGEWHINAEMYVERI